MADAPEMRSACEMLSVSERILLLAAQHPHRLLELAVKRGGFLDRHADALRDGEQFLLRDRVLAAASGGELPSRADIMFRRRRSGRSPAPCPPPS